MKYMLYNIKITIAHTHKKQYLCSRIINHLIISNMKKKLTKNDRLSNKQHKLEVATAAFKALLNRRGLFESYFHAWNCDTWRQIDTPADIAWDDWAKEVDIEYWVSEAFIWAGSSIPSSVWRALDLDWFEYCEQYLNK